MIEELRHPPPARIGHLYTRKSRPQLGLDPRSARHCLSGPASPMQCRQPPEKRGAGAFRSACLGLHREQPLTPTLEWPSLNRREWPGFDRPSQRASRERPRSRAETAPHPAPPHPARPSDTEPTPVAPPGQYGRPDNRDHPQQARARDTRLPRTTRRARQKEPRRAPITKPAHLPRALPPPHRYPPDLPEASLTTRSAGRCGSAREGVAGRSSDRPRIGSRLAGTPTQSFSSCRAARV